MRIGATTTTTGGGSSFSRQQLSRILGHDKLGRPRGLFLYDGP